MPFFKPLSGTARDLVGRWPIHGVAYVIAFFGGISGGACVGAVCRGALGAAIGLASGIAVTLPFAWLSDRHLGPFVAKVSPRKSAALLGNTIALAIAVALTFSSMALTLAILLNLGA